MNSNSEPDLANDPVRWRVLWVLLASIFMSLIDVSIVNVAVPAIQEGLGAHDSDIQWVLSGYALTFGVVLVAAGRAGDILGRGGLFAIGVLIFTVTSIWAGLASSPESLVLARFMQGVGSGILSPQGMGMIQQYFRGSERARAFGYLGSTVGVAVGIGPVLGGFLIGVGGPEWGWRLAFLVKVPLGIVVLALVWAWFPKPLLHKGIGSVRGILLALDPVGSFLAGLAVLAVLYPFVEFHTSPWAWGLLGVGLFLTALWVWWERQYLRWGFSPMVDLGIFQTRSFSNGILIMSLYFMGMTSIWVLVPLYLQIGLGKTALQASLVGVGSAVISAFAANWAGRRVMDWGRKIVIAGFAFAVLGLVVSALVIVAHDHGLLSVWWLALSLLPVGIAQGLVISPNQTLTLAEVPIDYAGSSGAVMQTGQRIGTAVGIALITAVVFSLHVRVSWQVATIAGFGIIVLVVLVAMAVAYADWRRRAPVAVPSKAT